ncbi:transporter substrate-binding domain-containing protein [Devosia pacifica]|uniref:transporter substrate-binding domain-containing protein n=1 Tax=Devosia pacifica TaxID=1335967 RepID=UPI001679772B|nr:transporter substrate-binding domain-containing protein [Devosia pacifica]
MITGLVASAEGLSDARELADDVAKDIGVELEVTSGTAEDLLRGLERGRFDMVIGEFAANSPWSERVVFVGPDPNNVTSDFPTLRAAVRKGENRWLARVEAVAREHS